MVENMSCYIYESKGGVLSYNDKYSCAFYPPPRLAEGEVCFMPSFTFLYKFDNFLCFVNYRPSKLCGKDVMIPYT